MLSDASCVPGDIRYPNDLGILNEARVASEEIIDNLYEAVREKVKKKPKTYRKLARKDYLKVAKKRKPRTKQRKKAIKKQLQYLKRNLGHIEQLMQAGALLEGLSAAQYKRLLVITEVYRQQQVMYQKKSQRIDDRIVSISQPHIRPIVRGKAGTSVEFGAKISVSCLDEYAFLYRVSWDNFNESVDLKEQIE
ncbi:MAG: IS5/IS1182 family transposase, partial [Symploca sp. SIO2E6]|nr:IS5/IS1182 family transposase [Symploca sp. SIO2E6]